MSNMKPQVFKWSVIEETKNSCHLIIERMTICEAIKNSCHLIIEIYVPDSNPNKCLDITCEASSNFKISLFSFIPNL